MYELDLELSLPNGECFDNTVTLLDDNLETIKLSILDFVEDYFNEGFRECDPRYFDLEGVDIRHLKLGRNVTLNGLLKVRLSAGIMKCL